MRRRRKVEGLTLDLRRIVNDVPFMLEDLIVGDDVSGDCEVCGSPCIGAVKLCGDKKKCGICRAVTEGRITRSLRDRLQEEYAKPCGFCEATAVRKHFDHVNMFTKHGSVGEMVECGASENAILTEIDKCQILCVPCHREVTSFEICYGFMAKKRAFNKLLRAGDDVDELRAALVDEYQAVMGPYYEAAVSWWGNKRLTEGGVSGHSD